MANPTLFTAVSAAFSAAVSTFKKSYVRSPMIPGWDSLQAFDTFNSFEGRIARYSLYWALYENTAYDDWHKFGRPFKRENDLYRATRGVINPVNRLVELHATHTWGGTLDDEAGDGKGVPSALPIITKNDALRPAIARLWRDSFWQGNKTICARLGASLGDVAIRVNDDPEKGLVQLDVIHPASLRWVRKDRYGNVKAYQIQEWRIDPEYREDANGVALNLQNADRACLYTEWCDRDGETVVIRTFRNGLPYDWDGNGAVRYLPYGFVPMVLIHHLKVSTRDQWGWAEHHSGLTKVMESDDLASKLNDQIRKCVEGAWFITNAHDGGRASLRVKHTAPKAGDEDVDQNAQEMKILYGGNGGTAVPLLFPLDIQFTTLHIDFLQKVFKADYPELEFDSARVSGDASAKALREVKKKSVAKFNERRSVYDNALRQAQQMAIAIGGYRGYDGYQGFGLESYKDGKLDHRIGVRPVYENDAMDRNEEELSFWTAAESAGRAGLPLDVFLLRNGWQQSQVDEYMAAKTRDEEQAAQQQQAQAEQQAKLAQAKSPAPGDKKPTP